VQRIDYEMPAAAFDVQVATGQFNDVTWSPRGDRLAFFRDGENSEDTPIWTVAVDANTGKLAGPPRRVSDASGDEPAFSPDGHQIAFAMDPSDPDLLA
jgi:Tol biopolymer transport system component